MGIKNGDMRASDVEWDGEADGSRKGGWDKLEAVS